MSDEPREPGPADESTEPPEPATDEQAEAGSGPAESDWQRRRRLAAVFGDVLPETTSDERSEREPGDSGNDEWLRRQVPPHHG